MHYQTVGRPRATRSHRDKVIAGVCGGLARHFDVSPTWMRIGSKSKPEPVTLAAGSCWLGISTASCSEIASRISGRDWSSWSA